MLHQEIYMVIESLLTICTPGYTMKLRNAKTVILYMTYVTYKYTSIE